jgi:tripartite-type tricarboxylate transporter receptor subunit TctC
MSTVTNHFLPILGLAGIVAIVGSTQALAQTDTGYPSKPLRLVIPFSAGAASDFLGRTVGMKLAELMGQQVVNDNRPGAGGMVGSAIVAKAVPDGYTLMVAAPPHLVNALIHPDAQYRPVDDYTAISQIAALPNLLVVPSSLAVKTVKDLVLMAKARPGELNFGSAGVGSLSHLGGGLFVSASVINAVHVPFKFFSDALTELFTVRIHFYVSPITAVMPYIRDGKLRPLAIAAPVRSPLIPEVPTMSEAALAAAQLDVWFGIVAPANTPKEIVQKIYVDISKVLKQQEMVDQLSKMGVEVIDNTPQQFSEQIKAEALKWGEIVKEGKITK